MMRQIQTSKKSTKSFCQIAVEDVCSMCRPKTTPSPWYRAQFGSISVQNIFCVNTLRWTTLESTITLQSQIGSRLSGQQPMSLIQHQSGDKVMAFIFWDALRILFIDYLEKDKNDTGLSPRHCYKSSATTAKLNKLHYKLLSTFSPPVTDLKNTHRKDIWFERGLFWDQTIFQERYRNIREALEWLHRSWRGLYWWIKLNLSEKFCFHFIR